MGRTSPAAVPRLAAHLFLLSCHPREARQRDNECLFRWCPRSEPPGRRHPGIRVRRVSGPARMAANRIVEQIQSGVTLIRHVLS